MNRLQFEVTNKDGGKLLCETIATYHDDDTNKDYIVYTDNTHDEENKLRVYYSLYEMKEKGIKLIEATTADEKRVGLELIKEVIVDVNEK